MVSHPIFFTFIFCIPKIQWSLLNSVLDPPPGYYDTISRNHAPGARSTNHIPYYEDDRNMWERVHECYDLSGGFYIMGEIYLSLL